MTTNSVNPKTGLPQFPAALCYWHTTDNGQMTLWGNECEGMCGV